MRNIQVLYLQTHTHKHKHKYLYKDTDNLCKHAYSMCVCVCVCVFVAKYRGTNVLMLNNHTNPKLCQYAFLCFLLTK